MRKNQITAHSGEGFVIISITDVTTVVQAQQRIAEHTAAEVQRRQWQALNAGTVVVDALQPDMPIIYVNPAFEQMCGYAWEEVVGRNCPFLQGEESGQVSVGAIRHAIREGTNGYAVLRNYRKDGSLFVNELLISPLRDSYGTVIQFLGIQHLRAETFTGLTQ